MLDADRLLPPDPKERTIARDLYFLVRDKPIISPHGHVPVQWMAQDHHFRNATELFITPDHYVTRFLHGRGVAFSDLGVGRQDFDNQQARQAFLLLGKHWHEFAGTPMRYWLEDSLTNVFGITTPLNEQSAGRIYDELSELLSAPEFSTSALVERFNIGFISTTDDPTDDLSVHDQVQHDDEFHPRLAPAFRPDGYLEVTREDWPELVRALGASAGVDATTYSGFTEAMKQRRLYFKQHGAVLSDHGVDASHDGILSADTTRLSESHANELFDKAMQGKLDSQEASLLHAHLLSDQAALAQEDDLVMCLHPGVIRNHYRPQLSQYGPDCGADIPSATDWVHWLRPVLNEYGNNPDFHMVAFTMDETSYSRELAPMAGFYPSLFIGAPWWFLDAPESILRYYEAVVPYAGFSNLSGFIDDTRALCSIPARHDMNRRLTARYVAGLVAEHRISKDEGERIVLDSVDAQPSMVFKL